MIYKYKIKERCFYEFAQNTIAPEWVIYTIPGIAKGYQITMILFTKRKYISLIRTHTRTV